MQIRLLMGLSVLLTALPAAVQETRGNINGVVQDEGGIVPGATVTITNTGTNQTQPRITNSKGYCEAVLLNPGTLRFFTFNGTFRF